MAIPEQLRLPVATYASIWLWCIAQRMLLQNWLAGWSVLPVFAVMYFLRTPREEQMMCDTFGEQYREYVRRTGRLFPRIKTQSVPHAEKEDLTGSKRPGDRKSVV